MADDNIVIVEEVLSLTVQTAVGATGPTGPSGVIAVTAPITNSGTSTSANIGIDQTGITVAQSQVTSLVSDLALKAPLASPTFTGTPAAPTATAGTNTTQVATTAFVTTADNLKANLDSPTFTGTPTLPTGTIATTQTAGNSTTAVATTAFVTAADQLLGTYTSYTPTLSNITIGNGTVTASYCRVNKFVHVICRIAFGSTTTLNGIVYITLPVNVDQAGTANFPFGLVQMWDNSSSSSNVGLAFVSGGLVGRAYLAVMNASGTYTRTDFALSATVPFTWAVNDEINFNLYYKGV
jgi:hypothetical protein